MEDDGDADQEAYEEDKVWSTTVDKKKLFWFPFQMSWTRRNHPFSVNHNEGEKEEREREREREKNYVTFIIDLSYLAENWRWRRITACLYRHPVDHDD